MAEITGDDKDGIWLSQIRSKESTKLLLFGFVDCADENRDYLDVFAGKRTI